MPEDIVKSGDYEAIIREAKVSEIRGIFGDQVEIIYELQETGKIFLEWYYLKTSHFKDTVEAILGHTLQGEAINLDDLVGKKCLLTIGNEIENEKTKNKIIDIQPIKSGQKESELSSNKEYSHKSSLQTTELINEWIKSHVDDLAAFAWDSYQSQGRGMIVVRALQAKPNEPWYTGAQFGYLDLAKLEQQWSNQDDIAKTQEYDPYTEFRVVVLGPHATGTIHTVQPALPPPQAYEHNKDSYKERLISQSGPISSGIPKDSSSPKISSPPAAKTATGKRISLFVLLGLLALVMLICIAGWLNLFFEYKPPVIKVSEAGDLWKRVCTGNVNNSSIGYKEGTGYHSVVLVAERKDDDSWAWLATNKEMPVEWQPSDANSVELVACLEPDSIVLEECPYFITGIPGVSILERRQHTLRMKLRDAKTGKIIASKSMVKGPIPSECPDETKFEQGSNRKRIFGGSVPDGQIFDWLRPFVEMSSTVPSTPTALIATHTLTSPTATPTSIPPTDTPISMPEPKSGHWKGKNVSFVVTTAGTITEFEITVNNCLITIDDEISIVSNDLFGSFSINPEGTLQGDVATGADFTTKANFESETTLSGTYSVQICGGSILFGSTDVEWAAEWQEASTVSTTPTTIAPVVNKIYWTDTSTGKIQRSNLDGSAIEDVVTGIREPEQIRIDTIGGKIYWVDSSTGKVQRANLDSSGLEDLVTGLSSPRGITLDITGGKMYWTDLETDKIQRANLDGTNIQDLVTTGLDIPIGIDLDLANGKIYWVDNGTDKIQRANLDGSGVEDVITGLSSPYDLTIDSINNKIYWTDRSTDKIQRANLDGSEMEDLIVENVLVEPKGIALDVTAGKMYWVDEETGKVYRANLNGSVIEELVTGLSEPPGIALLIE
ncbi:MAG: hypothetical protein H6631_13000 [Anaerolineaceae bacterium]|nr:hypothetical protein [Anaerolineaceae bacterium]MCB9099180.1 hypothetical protein [Anaerolineales bacterium]